MTSFIVCWPELFHLKHDDLENVIFQLCFSRWQCELQSFYCRWIRFVEVSLRTGYDTCPKIDIHIDWTISCLLMQSTIVKPLKYDSGDMNTGQNDKCPFTDLRCHFQPGILSIAEMLEYKYMISHVYDRLEESSRYSRCWMPSNHNSISTPGKSPALLTASEKTFRQAFQRLFCYFIVDGGQHSMRISRYPHVSSPRNASSCHLRVAQSDSDIQDVIDWEIRTRNRL
jgi:hypothetical protein